MCERCVQSHLIRFTLPAHFLIITFLGSMKRGVKKQSSNQRGGNLGSIRIIGGKWRGRKLPVLNSEGLRPTTDRTKETLFNWLMNDVQGSVCLDLFAGSGSLGFEALSRSAKQLVFVELENSACKLLRDNIQLLKVKPDEANVVHGEALDTLSSFKQNFDIIFVDPPFNKDLIPKVISTIESVDLLTNNGLVYIECEKINDQYKVPEDWQCIKEKSTKQVTSRIYRHMEKK